MLVEQARYREAKPLLRTAIPLGSEDRAAYYNLAVVEMNSEPADFEKAEETVQQALHFVATDPYVHSLAGKVALARKDFPTAVDHFQSALQALAGHG